MLRILSQWCEILIILLISVNCYATEQLTDFSDESLPILNNELKKIDDKVSNKIADEGDSSAVDFTASNLTTDATWRDLDLSTKIPKGVKWVILQVEVKDDATASELSFRKNGYYNTVNIGRIATQVANVSNYGDIVVQVDKDGKIEYKGSNLTFTTINITIRGYFR